MTGRSRKWRRAIGTGFAAVAIAAASRAAEPNENPDTQVVTVRAVRPTREAAAMALRPERASLVPGTQGDGVKAVQALPGISRPAFGLGPLIVWGAPPESTRIYVDGVEIPTLFHGGGIRSTVNSDLVRSVILVPGAYGPEHGRGLGGVVRLSTAPLATEGVSGFVAADLLDASARIGLAPHPKVRVAVLARQGYLDRSLDLVGAPEDLDDFIPVPRYQDAQGKIEWELGDDTSASAVVLHSEDSLTRSLPSADPVEERSETRSLGYERAYLTVRHSDDESEAFVTPYYGFDRRLTSARFGRTPSLLRSRATIYGLRMLDKRRLTNAVALGVGLDLHGARTEVKREGSLTLPPREGDRTVFGEPPASGVASDGWTVNQVDAAPFLYTELTFGAVSVTPGLRLDAYLLETSRKTPRVGATPSIGLSTVDTVLAPRIGVAYQPFAPLTLSASGGLYNQPPAAEDFSPVFGTPELGLSEAEHVAFSQRLSIDAHTEVETIEFVEWLDDLVVRSRAPSPIAARALVQDGQGRNYGVQALVRRDPDGSLGGSAALTVSRSERRTVDATRYEPADFDRTVSLDASLLYELGDWSVGARFRYATGLPRTPVASRYYDLAEGRYLPVLGELNSTRLPDFYQVDLRGDRRFDLGRVVVRLYLELLNVTFRENVEELTYGSDYSEKRPITGLPPLAVAGVKVEF